MLTVALGLNVGMMLIDWIAGVWAHSARLLADGLDMASGAGVYAAALLALSREPVFKQRVAAGSGVVVLLSLHRAQTRFRRSLYRAALLLCAAVTTAAAQSPGAPQDNGSQFALSLDRAMGRTLEKHPDLKLGAFEEQSLQSARDIAAQRPALTAGLSLQNALGTNETTGFKNAEITLTLASVLERGGKRDARIALSTSRLDTLDSSQAARRLDLLAEVARRFLDVVAAQDAAQIAAEDVSQRERTVLAATRRVQAGASPESAKLTAEAMLIRARSDRDRATRETEAAYRRLSILWSERDPGTARVAGSVFALPEVRSFAELTTLLDQTPELKRFAGEARIREARVQLARSSRSTDLNWEVGVQRLQDFNSWGFTAGFTMPLGAARRAEPEVRQSTSELQALSVERESAELTLYATLAQAYGQFVARKAEVGDYRSKLLPKLAQADVAAERAYRAGALSYLEWAQVQSETTAVRREELVAAVEAQRALIEIQRLTAEPFIKSNDPSEAHP